MGLPLTMDSMHAPTVPSGPTSTGSANGIKTAGKTLQELQIEKDNLEAELKALSGVLDSVCQPETAVLLARLTFCSMALI
jgi:26S proteasome regulatory subunit N4